MTDRVCYICLEPLGPKGVANFNNCDHEIHTTCLNDTFCKCSMPSRNEGTSTASTTDSIEPVPVEPGIDQCNSTVTNTEQYFIVKKQKISAYTIEDTFMPILLKYNLPWATCERVVHLITQDVSRPRKTVFDN